MKRWRAFTALLLVGALVSAALALTGEDVSRYVAQGRRSGSTFLSPQTRAQQNDEFANPGMLWVEQGQRLWSAAAGSAGSCLGCHGDAAQSMRGVAARYPAFDRGERRVINLEQRINACRVKNQHLDPLAYESQELLALTAFISRQSHGMSVAVPVNGPATKSFERGRAMFYRPLGQLDMACAACHEQRVGTRLRGEVISQGQINGHPAYRHLWQTMGSTHRMFSWCNEAVRAEPYAYGSQDYVDLELFVKWRGRGLPVETPAIRR